MESTQVPKVSVIVPVYNVEPYLCQCLDSLTRQTLKEIEIIVVDDGSTDHCPKIIDEYANEDKRILPIHKGNGGVSAARNDGIAKARGEYVFFCDSDDWLAEDALEVMVEKADETQSDIVIGDFCEVNEKKFINRGIFDREFVTDSPSILKSLQCMVLPKGFTNFKTSEFKGGYCLAAPWHHIIRSKIIKDNSLVFDTYVKGIFDDGLFMLSVFENIKKVSYISKTTYFYRVLTGSITHKYDPEILNKYQRVYERLGQFRTLYGKDADYDQVVYMRVINYLNKAMSVYFMNAENKKSQSERYKDFIKIVKTDPYSRAISSVKIKEFYSRNTKVLVILLKLRLYRIYWSLKKRTTNG